MSMRQLPIMRTREGHSHIRWLTEVILDLGIVDSAPIKDDAQEAQDKAISGGEQVFSRVVAFVLEATFVPRGVGQILFDAIYDRLRRMGFADMGIEHIIRHPRTGRVLQCGSLFLRQTP